MNVLGYDVGPTACEAAFIADFDIDPAIPIEGVVTQMHSDRRTMAVRDGMIMKYVPFRFDPATGAHQIGGRYLFDTEAQMRDYARFTVEELEFEPGVKFWDRPFFSNVERRAWRVLGAHAFLPVATHYASRVERFALSPGATVADVEAMWPLVRDTANTEGLAAVWLLADPDGGHVALLTAAPQQPDDEIDLASRSLAALEHRPSLSRLLAHRIEALPLSDRTSLNLAIWLPRSDALGGDACIFPTYPAHPLPVVPD